MEDASRPVEGVRAIGRWLRRPRIRLPRARASSAHWRLLTQPRRGWAAVRLWIRGGEIGLVALGVIAGAASGLLVAGMRATTSLVQVLLFGEQAAHGLDTLQFSHGAMHGAAALLLVLLVPGLGGLLLGLANIGIARVWPRTPIDPIEANALYGGVMSLRDAGVVTAQNIVSNGFGASVGLEAAFTQVGSSVASRLGRLFNLRRADLRVLVGCGSAGAIAAAFGAPLTGAFYAFELVIGSYAIPSLIPVIASAVTASQVANLLSGPASIAETGGIGAAGWHDYGLALLIGVLCGLVAIVLMRGMSVVESLIRRCVPWPWLRPAVGGLVVGALACVNLGVLSSGHGALHFVFSTDIAPRALLILLVLKTVACALSIGSGFRGGLFFASLLLGALLGKLFALEIIPMLPETDPLLMAIVGMCAFGAAVVGAPLGVTFLAFETTHDFAVAGVVLMAVIHSTLVVRRLFGYSFATWRFHLRGETIRSAHDIGWVRELTVGRLMQRNVQTVRADTRVSSFLREVPLGSTERVVALDDSGGYAGIVDVAKTHAAGPSDETLMARLRHTERMLLPRMNAKEAMGLFERAEAEALVVVANMETRQVIGLLTEANLLRRYAEELDKRRAEEAGLT